MWPSPPEATMKSSRPYLLRAIHEWIVDNGCTPFLLVNAEAPGVDVPREYIENDKIILNIGPTATQGLVLGDEEVSFQARFGGQPRPVSAPMNAVLAIYARENGQGMLFTDEAGDTEAPGRDGDSTETGEDVTGEDGEPSSPGKPNLRVIK